MTDYVTFEAAIEPVVWGPSNYTILRLPDEVVAALGPTRRVEGEMAEHPINLALTRAPVVEGAFLWAGQSLMDRIGTRPGERLEVRLRPAPDDAVDLPDDVAAALRAQCAWDQWQALTPGKQRGLLYQIGTAKTAATRDKRIANLVRELTT